MIRVAEDQRPIYAAKLREVAEMIEKNDIQPVGIRATIFMADGTSLNLNKHEPGTNHFAIAGALLMQSIDELRAVRTTIT